MYSRADNALSNEAAKASNRANDAVDCFVQFDQSKEKKAEYAVLCEPGDHW